MKHCLLGLRLLVLACVLLLGRWTEAQVPAPPSLFALQVGSDVSLSWAPVAGATSYNVYRTNDLDVPVALIASPATPGFVDVGVVDDLETIFYYQVTSVAVAGESAPSNRAYRLRFNHRDDPLDNTYRLLSLPYRYDPNPATSDTTALEICRDLEGEGCARPIELTRFNKFGSVLSPVRQHCSAPVSIWNLTPGEGLFMHTESVCPVVVVGATDTEFALGGAAYMAITTGWNSIAPPYDVAARGALDLCRHIAADNPGVVLQSIGRLDLRRRAFVTQLCRAPVSIFNIEPGEAYFITPEAPFSDFQWRLR